MSKWEGPLTGNDGSYLHVKSSTASPLLWQNPRRSLTGAYTYFKDKSRPTSPPSRPESVRGFMRDVTVEFKNLISGGGSPPSPSSPIASGVPVHLTDLDPGIVQLPWWPNFVKDWLWYQKVDVRMMRRGASSIDRTCNAATLVVFVLLKSNQQPKAQSQPSPAKPPHLSPLDYSPVTICRDLCHFQSFLGEDGVQDVLEYLLRDFEADKYKLEAAHVLLQAIIDTPNPSQPFIDWLEPQLTKAKRAVYLESFSRNVNNNQPPTVTNGNETSIGLRFGIVYAALLTAAHDRQPIRAEGLKIALLAALGPRQGTALDGSNVGAAIGVIEDAMGLIARTYLTYQQQLVDLSEQVVAANIKILCHDFCDSVFRDRTSRAPGLRKALTPIGGPAPDLASLDIDTFQSMATVTLLSLCARVGVHEIESLAQTCKTAQLENHSMIHAQAGMFRAYMARFPGSAQDQLPPLGPPYALPGSPQMSPLSPQMFPQSPQMSPHLANSLPQSPHMSPHSAHSSPIPVHVPLPSVSSPPVSLFRLQIDANIRWRCTLAIRPLPRQPAAGPPQRQARPLQRQERPLQQQARPLQRPAPSFSHILSPLPPTPPIVLARL